MDYSIQDRASLKQWEEFKVYKIMFTFHAISTYETLFDSQVMTLFLISHFFALLNNTEELVLYSIAFARFAMF